MEKVQNATDEDENMSLDVMRDLLNESVNLAPHAAVEKALAELQQLHTISERLEDRARQMLQAR